MERVTQTLELRSNGSLLGCRAFQVGGRLQCQRTAEHRPISYEGCAGTQGHGKPLVRIDGERVDFGETLIQGRDRRIENAESSIGSIHM